MKQFQTKSPMFEAHKTGNVNEDTVRSSTIEWVDAKQKPKRRIPVLICIDGRDNTGIYGDAHFKAGVFEPEVRPGTCSPRDSVVCRPGSYSLDKIVDVEGCGDVPVSPDCHIVLWEYVKLWAPITEKIIPWGDVEDMPETRRPEGSVYIIRAGDTNYYKIGFTSRGIDQRMREIQGGNPLPLELVASWEAPRALETKIHHIFTDCRQEGEWFELSADEVLRALPKITEILG